MYCVTHAWSGSFLEMVAALAEELAPAHGAELLDEDIYVWLDLFALDHTSATPSVVVEAGIAVEEAQAACSKGEVMGPNSESACLGETGCSKGERGDRMQQGERGGQMPRGRRGSLRRLEGRRRRSHAARVASAHTRPPCPSPFLQGWC